MSETLLAQERLVTTRWCSSCQQTKVLGEFYPSARFRLGVSTRCKSCNIAAVRIWQQEHKERYRARTKKWAKEHPEYKAKYAARYRKKNKERVDGYRKKWTMANPRKVRNKTLLYTSGITLEEYEAMLKSQKGVCAICKRISSDGRNLCVDHNHKTGKIRGLLCSWCNKGLGSFRDERKRLAEAVRYLDKEYGNNIAA